MTTTEITIRDRVLSHVEFCIAHVNDEVVDYFHGPLNGLSMNKEDRGEVRDLFNDLMELVVLQDELKSDVTISNTRLFSEMVLEAMDNGE